MDGRKWKLGLELGLGLGFKGFLVIGRKGMGVWGALGVLVIAFSFSVGAVVWFLANLFQLVTALIASGGLSIGGPRIKGTLQLQTGAAVVSDTEQRHSRGTVSVTLDSADVVLTSVILPFGSDGSTSWRLPKISPILS